METTTVTKNKRSKFQTAKKVVRIKSKRIKRKVKSMTYEDWWNIFQAVGVGLVALTFTVGSLVFFLGYKSRQEKDRKAAEQRERIAELTKDAELLKNNTATLEKEVADAKTKQAQAERALLELQEKLKGRRLTDKQKASLLSKLKDKPKGTIEFFTDNTAEARLYVADWVSLMKDVGWVVLGDNTALIPLKLRFGDIGIDVKADKNPAAVALQQALMSEGFSVPFARNNELKDDRIVMYIGTKQ